MSVQPAYEDKPPDQRHQIILNFPNTVVSAVCWPTLLQQIPEYNPEHPLPVDKVQRSEYDEYNPLLFIRCMSFCNGACHSAKEHSLGGGRRHNVTSRCQTLIARPTSLAYQHHLLACTG